MKHTHWSRWLVRIQLLLIAIIFMAGLALRLELVHFRPVFQVFKYAGLGALGMALVSMLVFIWGLVKRHADARRAALWGVVLGLLPVAVPLLTVGKGNFDVPPIHDITTDLSNPPEYQAILSLREEGDNSAAYDGEAVAQQQREADIYEDIRPLELDLPVAKVTGMAAQVAEDLGWRIVARDDETGHLEAVDRTALLGFSDDVVVRVTPAEDGSRVDIRSSSRVGVSDLGANARRIREFLVELEELAAEQGQQEG
ncbi:MULTISPECIES: DUF1499 domain-containing protein [unclassified Microbulbifer]|uniref:DUF1499 domain-containing protein n=1 Tax=unclassified Microbulbifer TaxID=2619833 RepID=UPI001E5452EE|nr:DUF1499 domain-containing protein [Microbulbifer sp. YPW16]UHQ56064.1 DUF1499 domain-containing protein [Microbulbifer sp. YPW16]